MELALMNNQRVIVTAGEAGIGREIARAFAANGAKVFVCDIDGKMPDALAQEIKGLVTNVCDVSKRADIERMMAAAVSALGGLDVLVNNAGISGPTAPVEQMDPDQWERGMQVDLTGTFNVTRRKRRLFNRLSRIKVRIVYADSKPIGTRTAATGDSSPVSLQH